MSHLWKTLRRIGSVYLHRPYCFCHDTIFTSLTCHIYYLPFCMTAMQFIQSRSAYFNFVSEWYHIEYLSTQSTIIYNWDYLYWCLWCFPWFQLAYRPLWLTALGTFSISACLSVFFGWLLWRFRWFQLAFWLLWLTALGTFSISACLYGLFRLTALAFSLILACLSASLSDCFGDFADFSLPISFFEWLLWCFRWFQLAYWLLSGDCFGAFADSSLFLPLYI